MHSLNHQTPGKLRAVLGGIPPLSQWETEQRRKLYLVISLVLCIGFFVPVYYLKLIRGLTETFSLAQLLIDPTEYSIDDEGRAAYLIYLVAPAVMGLLAYRWKSKDLFRFSIIPSALYLVLFFATRHVTMEERYQKYFGLTFFGYLYLVLLALAVGLSIWELVASKDKGANPEEAAPATLYTRARPSTQASQFARQAPAMQPNPILAQLPEQMDNGPRFCAHCGSPLKPGARFCAKCGTAVRDAHGATIGDR